MGTDGETHSQILDKESRIPQKRGTGGRILGTRRVKFIPRAWSIGPTSQGSSQGLTENEVAMTVPA